MHRDVGASLTLPRRRCVFDDVIAGLDPAIHLARELMDAGSRRGMTRGKFCENASKRITAVDNVMTPA
jgi:hypothetical protein